MTSQLIIPLLVLLAYVAWTLLTLFCSVGVYRWSRILTGRVSIAAWRADIPQGSEWYQRAMRAHMNCVENLPLYGAIVVGLIATGLQSPLIDRLAVLMLAARISQTLVHIGLSPSNSSACARFALFFVQLVCVAAMGIMVAGAALR